MNRTTLSVKNTLVSFVAQILTLVSQFVMQIVFVHQMSVSYIGANGLLANLMNLLSFAELGIGAAITFSLYKPLAENKLSEVDALLTFYKKVYRSIGVFILVVGAILAVTIRSFIKEGSSIPNIQLMFYLYVIGTAVSYFFSYSRSMFIADQKSYINTINQVGTRLVQNIVQIAVLILWHSYLGYLLIQIIGTILANYLINKRAKRDYPELSWQSRESIPADVLTTLKKNVLGNVSSKIGEIVVNGTDNIMISKFLGLSIVGIYSNYALITQGIGSLLSQVMNALIGTIGNIGTTETVDTQRKVYFQNLHLVSLASVVFAATFYLVSPIFISLLFGERFVLNNLTVLLISINLGFSSLRKANLSFTAALGLFWTMRYKALIEATTNFFFILLFMTKFNLGVDGVLLGNILSNLVINFWWEPRIVFKHGFNESSVKAILRFGVYHVFMLFILILTYFIIPNLPKYSWLALIETGVTGIIIYTMIFVLSFWFQYETRYIIHLIQKTFRRIIR